MPVDATLGRSCSVFLPFLAAVIALHFILLGERLGLASAC